MPESINLKTVHASEAKFQYEVDSSFFQNRQNSLINDGKLEVVLTLTPKGAGASFLAQLKLSGVLMVPCDLCLEDVEVPVDTEAEFSVKLGKEYDVTPELITIEESISELDVDSLIYEYAALSLPLHPVHKDGECNGVMADELSKYLVKGNDEE